jgi:hypothetical protein
MSLTNRINMNNLKTMILEIHKLLIDLDYLL